MHWNKLEWVTPSSCNEQKNLFCVSSKKICFKDDVKSAHWVDQLQWKSLDTDDFFKRTPVVDEKGLV